MKKIAIIIISYNTKKLTLECIRSVFDNTDKDLFELVVFDNASSDNSAQAIQEEFNDRIILIRSDENIGFAAGNNIAIQKTECEYVLLLNPDTLVLDRAIEKIINFAENHPDALIWGGKTLFPDYSLNPGSCWSRQTIWGLISKMLGLSSIFSGSTFFNPEGIGGWDRENDRYVDIVSGCFLLLKREFWDKLGGFNKKYFMYGEDADLCLRASKLGAKPLINSSSTIIHYGGASEKVQEDKLIRLLQAKMMLIDDHFHPALIKIGLTLLSLWPLSRYISHMVLELLGRKKSRERKEVWKQVWLRRTEWYV